MDPYFVERFVRPGNPRYESVRSVTSPPVNTGPFVYLAEAA